MNAHHAVSEHAQTRIVRIVVRNTLPWNNSLTRGAFAPIRLRAACHSSGSGTLRRIQNTISAGSNPTRNTNFSGDGCPLNILALSPTAAQAISTPMFTPVWSTAAIQGPHFRGHVSERSAEPTAHSPPIPRAEINRKISSCHQVCAKKDRPVKAAYTRMVSDKARLRPIKSPTRPKNPPPSAQPTRNDAWIHDVLSVTSRLFKSVVLIKCATNGAATRPYKCMSSPSNSHPSHAAMPDFHCAGERSRKLFASARAMTGSDAPALDGISGVRFDESTAGASIQLSHFRLETNSAVIYTNDCVETRTQLQSVSSDIGLSG